MVDVRARCGQIGLPSLVPAERVLGHDWGADHLTAGTRTGVIAAGREAAGGHHVWGIAERLGHSTGSRGRTPVELTLLSITTGDPEHPGTVGCRSANHTDTDADRARPRCRAAAGAGIPAGTTCVAAATVTSAIAAESGVLNSGGHAAAGNSAAGDRRGCSDDQRNRGVDERHQSAYGSIWLLVETRVGIVEHLRQCIHQMGRDVNQRGGGDVAGALRVVVGPDRIHGESRPGNLQCILQTLGDIKEDLRRRERVGGHETVLQLAVET